jgi:hypothetical protein
LFRVGSPIDDLRWKHVCICLKILIYGQTDLREAARKMQAEAEKKPFVGQLGHDSVTVALPAQAGAVN